MACSFRTIHVFVAAAIVCSFASSMSTQEDLQDCGAEEVRTDLMQRQGLLQHSAATEAIPAPRTLPTPVTWLHIPRTGTSFAYTLLFLKDLCPGLMDDRQANLREIHVTNVVHQCPGLNVDGSCSMVQTYGHCAESPIGGSARYAEIKGKIVGFFRQPEIRTISDYHNSGLAGVYGIKGFATERQGCVTKMLAYDDDELADDHCMGPAPSEEKVAIAIERVQTGYAFIGMTDDWNLSICLFNAMFGQECHAAQFESYGGHVTTYDTRDLSVLRGFEDIYDGAVFTTARVIWMENLLRYNISEETCQAACPFAEFPK